MQLHQVSIEIKLKLLLKKSKNFSSKFSENKIQNIYLKNGFSIFVLTFFYLFVGTSSSDGDTKFAIMISCDNRILITAAVQFASITDLFFIFFTCPFTSLYFLVLSLPFVLLFVHLPPFPFMCIHTFNLYYLDILVLFRNMN